MKVEFITLSTDGEQTFTANEKYPLPILAPLFRRLTPADIEFTVQDQNFAPIKTSTSADVVAISLNTPVATRAYELGAMFAEQGKIVVYGGPHITEMHRYPEFRKEAFNTGKANTVFIGSAENTWPVFINDLVQGSHKKRYIGQTFRFERRIVPDRGFFRDYVPKEFKPKNEITTIESSRGCPHSCTYCAATGAYIPKPLDQLVAEISQDVSNAWHFTDSNIAHTDKRLREVTGALTGLGIEYSGSISTMFINQGNVDRLAKSGCVSLYIGFESINPDSLDDARKRFNRPGQYTEIVKMLHDYGIKVVGAVVFGFDHDKPDTFERTWDFIIRAKLDQVSFHVLIPYPGTRLFNQLRQEIRLLYTNFPQDWGRYGYDDVVFRPKHMSPEFLLHQKNLLESRFHTLTQGADIGVTSTNTGSYRHPINS